MRNDEKRFEVVLSEKISLACSSVLILRDRETGINYLFTKSGYAGGLTPLLDQNGKPVVN